MFYMNTSYGFSIMFDFYDKLFTIYRFVIALFNFLGVVVSNVVHSNTTGGARIVAIFIYMSYAINMSISATASVTYIPIRGEMYTLYYCHN